MGAWIVIGSIHLCFVIVSLHNNKIDLSSMNKFITDYNSNTLSILINWRYNNHLRCKFDFAAYPDTLRILEIDEEVHALHVSWDLIHPSGTVTGYMVHYTPVTYTSSSYEQECTTAANATSTRDSQDCLDMFEANPMPHCTQYIVQVFSYDNPNTGFDSAEMNAYTQYGTNINIFVVCLMSIKLLQKNIGSLICLWI